MLSSHWNSNVKQYIDKYGFNIIEIFYDAIGFNCFGQWARYNTNPLVNSTVVMIHPGNGKIWVIRVKKEY